LSLKLDSFLRQPATVCLVVNTRSIFIVVLNKNYDVMPLLILLLLVLVGSWLFSEVLVFLPLQLLYVLTPPHWLIITGVLIVLFWCFGD